MAQYSFPWDGDSTAGGIGDCGPYTAEFGAEINRALYMDSDEVDERGPLAGWYDDLGVIPTTPISMNVTVRSGAALVYGRWYENSADLNLAIANNAAGLTRYDRVVLRASWAAQTIRAAIVQGVAGAGVPALTQIALTTWEVPLATVTVINGAVSIAATDIADGREFVAPRDITLGLGDFETDLTTNTADIFAIGATDMRGWRFDAAGESIYATKLIPAEWGDTPLTCVAHGWSYGTAGVQGVNLWCRAYTSGDAPGNYVIWGSYPPIVNQITYTEFTGFGSFSVTPGQLLAIKIERAAGNQFFLGLHLHFWRT